jgi:hypothetical protein
MLKKLLVTMSLGLAISVNVLAQGRNDKAAYSGSSLPAAPAAFIQAPAMDRASVGVLPLILTVPSAPAPQMDLRKARDSTKSVSLQYPACSMVHSYSVDNGWPGQSLKKDDWKKSDKINLHILASGCSVGHGTDLQSHPITYLTLVVNGQIYDMRAEAGNWFKGQIPMHVWASATHMELKQ